MADNANRRFQLQVSECVETKTVTTTTRLTRQFPHVFVRDPTPLERLDSKEYPLASKATPPELLSFSYNLLDSGRDADGNEQDGEARDPKFMHRLPAGNMTPMAVKFEPAAHDFPATLLEESSRPTRSPFEMYPRRTRQTCASLAESPHTTSAADAAAPFSQLFLKTSSTKPSRTSARSSNLHAVTDKLRRSLVHATGPAVSTEVGCGSAITTSNGRRASTDRPVRDSPGFLATPDASELPGSSYSQRSSRRRLAHLEPFQSSPPDAAPTLSQSALCDAVTSPAGSDSLTVFSSTVATPPITDADAPPFGDVDVDEALQQSVRSLHHRPAIDVVAAQDASLPSPRLSPTLAASQPPSTDHDDNGNAIFDTSVAGPDSAWIDDSQVKQGDGDLDASASCGEFENLGAARSGGVDMSQSPVVLDTQTMLEAFDSMKTDMKTFMMYQFLRRCPRPTLRVIADTVNPALKCDFLQQLPLELAYHVLSYVDCRDLCRAAQVSKHWRNIVDRNETGWKELFDREGFTLPNGELHKAIEQGWGWQDPIGAAGYEKDLSMLKRLKSSEAELTRNSRQDVSAKLRNPKRKRGLNTYAATDRSKCRAAPALEAASSRDATMLDYVQHAKSEGPLTAATQAAHAIPDPQLGLPSLRQLHLFKSLYRRHHMIRRSWTSGEVKPSHVAFAAHPRHVITCLQFDDDKIITGSDDTLIHIYDTKTGKLRKRLEGHEGGVWALQYEDNILVSGSTDRSVRVWDIERGLCQQVFYGHTSTVRCLQILMPTEMGKDAAGYPVVQPQKPLIITGSRDSQLRVWRLPQPGSRRYIQTHPPAQESDCPYFIRVLAGHTHSVRAISAHGDTLVSGSYDSTVRVWRISTGDALHVLRGHAQKVYSVVLDHERNRCISGSMDSLVKIWDLTTGACLYTLEGHTLLVGLLDLHEERLVSAAADSTLRIWDPETGRCRHTLMAHTGAITCFQHDGRKVVSGSEKTVKMWDVQTGECVQDLLTDLSGVWQVKFDGRRCVAAVQRDQLTYVEILDFGAIRDGQPPENLGKRILLNEHEVRDIVDDSLA